MSSFVDLRNRVIEHLGTGERAQWPSSSVVVRIFGVAANKDGCGRSCIMIDGIEIAEAVDQDFVRC